MVNKILITFFFVFQGLLTFSHNIDIQIDNYPSDKIYMHQYYGNTSILLDSIFKSNKHFIIKKSDLSDGLYFITSFQDKVLAEFVVSVNEPDFSIRFDFNKLGEKIQVLNSSENSLLQNYHSQLLYYSDLIQGIQNAAENYEENTNDYLFLKHKIDTLENESLQFQEGIVKSNPKSMVALLIEMAQEPKVSIEIKDEASKKSYFYAYRNVFLENIDFKDNRLLFINNFVPRLDLYLDKLIPQNKDSVIYHLSDILGKTSQNLALNKYLKGYFIEKYYNSKVLEADAVFVDIAENYLNADTSLLTEKRQKYLEEAQSIRPLLIGKIAPNLQNLIDKDAKKHNLYNLASKFTVIYFFRPDCSSCKQSIEPLKRILSKHQNNGLSIVAICNIYKEEVSTCWDYIKTYQLENWFVLSDPYFLSKYEKQYRVIKTPLIYLLDAEKKILLKEISAEQLEELIDNYIK